MEIMNEYEQAANKFLKDTETTLNIQFNRFDSMDWDKEGQKRNIFVCTLSNSKGNYSFDFGNSTQSSCKELMQIDLDEKIEIFAGYEIRFQDTKYNNIIFSTKIYTCFADLKKIDKGEMQINELYKESELLKVAEDCKKRAANNPKLKNRFDRKEHEKNILRHLTLKQAEKCIYDRVTEKIKSAKQTKVLANEQKEAIELPTNYDILACLNVDYSVDFEDFCDNFGYSNDSIQALRIYEAVTEQSNELKALFTDKELEKLHEIN